MKETTYNRKQRTTRLMNVLVVLKEKCDSGDFAKKGENLKSFLYDNSFKSGVYSMALNRLGIVYKDGGNVWRWNDKLPVTFKLASRIIDETTEIYKAQQASRLKTTPTTPTIKATKGKIQTVRVAPRVIKHEPELGLIRRFFKWIY
jgi:hypothetical protein